MPNAHLAQFARIGTEKSGFIRAEEYGPGGCGHCRHMRTGVCTHPEVKRDTAPVLSKRNERGFPYVDGKDRCEYWQPKHKPKPAADKSGMRG